MIKNILKLFGGFCIAIVLFSSCAKADSEFSHTDNTISAILLMPAKSTISTTILGTIDNEAGTIQFVVPKKLRSSINLSEVKLRATVGYDVVITPSLSGIKDLTEELEIIVTATQTKQSKQYKISASYER